MTIQDVDQLPDLIAPYSEHIETLIAEALFSRVRYGIAKCFFYNEEGGKSTDNYITCADEDALVKLLAERMKPVVTRKMVVGEIRKPFSSKEVWSIWERLRSDLVRTILREMLADGSLWFNEGSNKWNLGLTTIEDILKDDGKPYEQRKRDTHVLTTAGRR